MNHLSKDASPHRKVIPSTNPSKEKRDGKFTILYGITEIAVSRSIAV